MGTRGVLGVRIDGVDKLAYNHFDSCPGGLGNNLVAQLKVWKKSGWDKVMAAARAVRLVTDKTPPTAEDVKNLGKFADTDAGSGNLTDWYTLLRETQGDIHAILEAGVMEDAHEFILDSLFCEWGYIVNFDTMTLEVYQGFQRSIHELGRYAEPKASKNGYFPCALVAEFKLDKLPKDLNAALKKRGILDE